MATKTIQFNPNGGSISVVMSCGQANTGNYNLMLIERDRIKIVEQFPITTFSTPPANTHVLSDAANNHDGRFVRSFSSIGFLGTPKVFSVFMKLEQDGKQLGEVSEKGTGSDLTKKVELVAKLAAVAAGVPLVAPGAPAARRRTGAKRKARSFAALNAKVDARTKALLRGMKKESSARRAKAKSSAKTKAKPRKKVRSGKKRGTK